MSLYLVLVKLDYRWSLHVSFYLFLIHSIQGCSLHMSLYLVLVKLDCRWSLHVSFYLFLVQLVHGWMSAEGHIFGSISPRMDER